MGRRVSAAWCAHPGLVVGPPVYLFESPWRKTHLFYDAWFGITSINCGEGQGRSGSPASPQSTAALGRGTGSAGCGGVGGQRGGGRDVELTNTATVLYTQRKPEIRH